MAYSPCGQLSDLAHQVGRWSTKWSTRSEERKKARQILVEALYADKHLQLLTIASEGRARSRSIYLLVAALGFLMVGLWIKGSTTLAQAMALTEPLWWFRKVLGAAAVSSTMLSMQHALTAYRLAQSLNDALDRNRDA
jgi:hypothetical protein